MIQTDKETEIPFFLFRFILANADHTPYNPFRSVSFKNTQNKEMKVFI